MTRVTLTEEYVLVETDDIDFSVLRAAVQAYEQTQQAYYINELPLELTELLVTELQKTIDDEEL